MRPESAQGSATPALLRIGELSRRTGVNVDTLRAWERRYGILEPARSDGGFRLYSANDEERARAMRGLISEGLSAAQAAADNAKEFAAQLRAHPSVTARSVR